MKKGETKFMENTKKLKERNFKMGGKMCQEFNETYGRCLRHEQS